MINWDNGLFGEEKDKDYVDKFEKEIKNLSKSLNLFFSFDIVNSSRYKRINYKEWSVVLYHLLNEIKDRVSKEMESAVLWRAIGDEMIFFINIKNIDNISEYVNKIFKLMCDFTRCIYNEEFYKKYCSDKDNVYILKLQNNLAIQAAAWIAAVTNEKYNIHPYENSIIEYYNNKSNYKIVDFIGNDIDGGFRIKKYTCQRRLVLSFELAYILSKKTDDLSKLNIITYRSLKGIWNERLYPIIWYHDCKIADNIKFEDSFLYDEINSNELVEEYINKKYNNIIINNKDNINGNKNLSIINKIARDMKIEEKIRFMYSYIENNKGSKMDNLFYGFPRLQVVAVCYRINNDLPEILIAKRSKKRKVLPNTWEFGGAKSVLDKTLVDSAINEYKEDFKIDIDVICDSKRKGLSPIPLALYSIKTEDTDENTDKTDKGIIIIAKIKEETKDPNLCKYEKHSEIKFITELEINKYNDEECVPDFKDTLEKAFEKIKELENKVDE